MVAGGFDSRSGAHVQQVLAAVNQFFPMQKFAKFLLWVVVFPIVMALFYMGVYQLFVALGASQSGLMLYYIFITLSSVGIIVYGINEVVMN
jgi:hypothetical protein